MRWLWYRGIPVLLISLLWYSVAGVKLQFDSFHYQTVDGRFYQELRDDLLQGKTPALAGMTNRQHKEFSPYPPGYPFLLAVVSFVKLPVPWPDYLFLHGFLLFVLGLIWCRYFPVWPFAVVFFSDAVLELGCYPWSEFSFVCFLLLSGFGLAQVQWRESIGWSFVLLLCMLASFSIRYIAVFLIPVLGWIFLFHKQGIPGFGKRVGLILAAFLFALFLYSIWEFMTYGQITGGDRYPNRDSAYSLAEQLGSELLNQVLLFKDASGSSAQSFWMGLVALMLVGWVFIRSAVSKPEDPGISDSQNVPRSMARYLSFMGGVYLALMIPVRWYFYFAEPFDFRLMTPGFCLLGMGVLGWFSIRYSIPKAWPVLMYLLLAVFFTLPKASIFKAYQETIWKQTKPVFQPL